jgi:hypothetical protein
MAGTRALDLFRSLSLFIICPAREEIILRLTRPSLPREIPLECAIPNQGIARMVFNPIGEMIGCSYSCFDIQFEFLRLKNLEWLFADWQLASGFSHPRDKKVVMMEDAAEDR